MSAADQSAFTIATGKPIYLEMAIALARSFRLWHRDFDIEFHLVTDRKKSELPDDMSDVNVITIEPGQFGFGFAPKLHLDKLAPAPRSMFIDADCLCVGPLDQAFETFSGHAVSVIGREISSGEWFGDVAGICDRFGITAMPRFNGGVYYLERGPKCSQIYDTARALLPRYDEIGFKRLRGHANDEVLMSLAIALEAETAIPERGDIMNSLLAGPGGLEIDSFKGHALLKNPRNHPGHNAWYDLEEMRPKLVHFLGSDLNTYPYRQEIIRLRLVSERKLPIWLATLWSKVTFSWPWLVTDAAKRALRPLYHALFGLRSMRAGARF